MLTPEQFDALQEALDRAFKVEDHCYRINCALRRAGFHTPTIDASSLPRLKRWIGEVVVHHCSDRARERRAA